MSVRVLTCVTCMSVEERKYVHDLLGVYRALKSVPRGSLAFVEFDATQPFEFTLNLMAGDGLLWQSPPVEVRPPASGRVTRIVLLPLRVAHMLPGAYNVRVVVDGQPSATLDRSVFYGEM
jgi:hypothetical protein